MDSKCREGGIMAESTLNTPMLWINKYLQEKVFENTDLAIPFFPVKPNAIDDLTEQWMVIDSIDIDGNLVSNRVPYKGILSVYDRLIRMRRSPFPHIKQEQALYYFYATQEDVTENMVQIQEAVLRLMDREDETAEEINAWAKGKSYNTPTGDVLTNRFFFHKFRVYQLEEVRDIIDFGTARTYGGNKIIIDFEYHQDTTITQ
jgi:hypothetical protein